MILAASRGGSWEGPVRDAAGISNSWLTGGAEAAQPLIRQGWALFRQALEP